MVPNVGRLNEMRKEIGAFTYKRGRQLIRSHRAEGCRAASLPTNARHALREKVANGTVSAVPLLREDKRTQAKGRTVSTLGDARTTWLRSAPGTAWFQEQTARWHEHGSGEKTM